MRKLALIFALMAVRALACSSGYISIVDPYLLPNGSPWTGTITYTFSFATTVNGATTVGTISTQGITSGINLCLAPGIYTPVVSVQSGQKPVTSQWTVPASGGPYLIANLIGGINLVTGATGATGPTGPTGPTGATGAGMLTASVTLTASQIDGMYSAPVLLLAAPGAGLTATPLSCMFNPAGNSSFSGGGLISVFWGNTSPPTQNTTPTISATLLTSLSANKIILTTGNSSSGAVGGYPSSGVINTGLYVSNESAPFTGGTGSVLNVSCEYSLLSGVQ